MDFKDAAMLVLMFLVFGVPALALAARLAVRPIVEAIVRVRESFGPAIPTPDPRIAALEAEITRLDHQVQRLAESEAFNRQLLQSGVRPASSRENE